MLKTDVFVWLIVNCKSLNFCLVDTLSAQLHCHMDYFIYCCHANGTHLPYSSFARNFEFRSYDPQSPPRPPAPPPARVCRPSKHDLGNMEYQHFINIFIEILNKHAPMKQKYLRANQGRFMTKDPYKAIMKRSRLGISFYV